MLSPDQPVKKRRKRTSTKLELAGTSMKDGDFVSAFSRGLNIIKAFSHKQPRMSVSDAAEITGLSRAVARRLLLTLVQFGYAVQDGEFYYLTPQVLELGFSYLSGWRVNEIVRPELQKVVSKYNENCSFGILTNDEVVNLARVEASRILRGISIVGGTRTPAAVGSLGRILLAGKSDEEVKAFLKRMPLRKYSEKTIVDPKQFMKMIKQVRSDGYVLVDGEYEAGLIAMGAPVRNRNGTVVAAINIGAPSVRMDAKTMLSTLKEPLLETAAEISRLLDLAGFSNADVFDR